MSEVLKNFTGVFRAGNDLNEGNAEALLDAMISEQDEPTLAELFQAWNEKGIAENEIFEIARIMQRRCSKISSAHATFVDIVGTGGSRAKTFNVSTAAAFVVAGAGVPVAKHGNRAATSSSGSADVLGELGIEPAVDAATAERCLNEIGICFMFAPNFHRLSPTLARVRRGLGFPTIFNCVGPLCNPAGAPHQVIGVWEEELVPKIANALSRLGTQRSWIVHGLEGLDEISLAGPTLVNEAANGSVKTFEISAGDFGIGNADLDNVRVTTSVESARLIRDVLDGQRHASPAENIVLLNAAAAIFITGRAVDLNEAFAAATESLRNGNALEKLNRLAAATKN